jgi:hypothetical protein
VALKRHLTLRNRTKAGLILHIGAGAGADIIEFLQVGFDDVVIMEPNPIYSDALKMIASEHKEVHFIEAAISETGNCAQINILNFSKLSTLKSIDKLYYIFPGIKVIDQPSVQTLSIRQLLATMPDLREDTFNCLVIEAPGTEKEILDALIAADALKKFQHVLVTCGRESYFEDSVPGGLLARHICDQGFKLIEVDDGRDYDWPTYVLERDQALIDGRIKDVKIALLEDRLDNAEALKAEAETAHEQAAQALRDRLDNAEAEKAEAETAHEQALQALRDRLDNAEAEKAEAETAHEQAAQALRDRLDNAEAEKAEAETAHEQAAQALRDRLDNAEAVKAEAETAHEQAAQTLKDRLDNAEAVKAEAETAHEQALQALRDRLGNAEAEKAEAETALKDLNETIRDREDKQRAELSMALRLQTMSRNDQLDLKQRYDTLWLEKEALEKLIAQLTQKLGEAASHLHLLSVQDSNETNPALDVAEPRSEPAQTLPRQKSSSKSKSKNKKTK